MKQNHYRIGPIGLAQASCWPPGAIKPRVLTRKPEDQKTRTGAKRGTQSVPFKAVPSRVPPPPLGGSNPSGERQELLWQRGLASPSKLGIGLCCWREFDPTASAYQQRLNSHSEVQRPSLSSKRHALRRAQNRFDNSFPPKERNG